MRKNKLTAICVKQAPDGRLYDGGGLMLLKSGQSGKWIFRYSHLGRRRDMGLGQWPQLSLASARAARDKWLVTLAEGNDPMTVRDQTRAAEKAERAQPEATLTQLIEIVFDARKGGLRGEGLRGRWMSPLDNHIIPAMGKTPVSQVTRHAIANALRPIWRTKHPTAIKAIARMRIILREGKLMGHDCDPFEVDAAQRILGDYHHEEKPIPAVPWQSLPELYQSLGYSAAEECLRWMILTLVREDGCLGARHDEIKDGVWTVPAERIKGRVKEAAKFAVPLSSEAQRVADRLASNGSPFMFTRTGAAPTNYNSITRLLNRMNVSGRPHGMRSAFKDWSLDTNGCSWEVSEMILGHKFRGRTVRAYARTDMLEMRRPAMEKWARYLTSAKSNVIRIRG